MSGQDQGGSQEGPLLASTLAQDREGLETEDQESSAEEAVRQAGKGKKKYHRHPKPPYTYLGMIALVIQNSPDRKLKLSQIIKEISTLFPFFQEGYQGWKDSIRHNLSSNSCFYKVLKDPSKPQAKGNFWTVDIKRIPAEALRLQNTPVSRQEERAFVADLAPYVLHGWPFPSSPAAQHPCAPERRGAQPHSTAPSAFSEGGSTAPQHSPFSINNLLSDFQDVGLTGKTMGGAEQLAPPSANSMELWGSVPIFCVSPGPPVLPYCPPCPVPTLQPSMSDSPTTSGSGSLQEGEAERQTLKEVQVAKRSRILQSPSSSSSAQECAPPQLPTSYTNCVAPNVVAPLSQSPPFSGSFSALPFYGGPVPCLSPMYWEVKAGHLLGSLPPPRLPVDLDQTVPPNKTVFDTWVTHPVDPLEPAMGGAEDFPRSPQPHHLNHF